MPNSTFIKVCYVFNSRDELLIAFPTKKNLHSHIITLVLTSILYIPTVLLNALTIRAVWRSPALKGKLSNINVMVNSVINIAVGIVCFPLLTVLLASEIAGHPSCLVFAISKKLGNVSYLFSLTAMSTMNIERYIAIFHPFAHRTMVTKQRLLLVTFCACCYETILFGFGFVYVDIVPYILTVVTVLFIASTVIVHCGILFSRLKNLVHPAVRNLSSSVEEARGDRTRQGTGNQSIEICRENSKHRTKQDLKAAKTCFVMMVCSLACFLPGLFSNVDRLRGETSVSIIVLRRWFALLFLCNSWINPVILFWRNKTLRTDGLGQICQLKNVGSKSTSY